MPAINWVEFGPLGGLLLLLVVFIWKLPEITKAWRMGDKSQALPCALAKGHAEELQQNLKSLCTMMVELQKTLDTLYAWHNVKDADGVPVWHFKPSIQSKVVESFNQQQRSADHFEEFMKAQYKHQRHMEEALLGLHKTMEIITQIMKQILGAKTNES